MVASVDLYFQMCYNRKCFRINDIEHRKYIRNKGDGSNMDYSTILAETENQKLTYGQLIEGLKQVGIKKGDNICVHSDLMAFGLFQLPKGEYQQAYVDALLEVIGKEGTLIMPTFSYSFCKNKVYNVQASRSTVGSLTEYFRKLPYVSRTKDPIFSFSVCGKNTERYLDIGEDCFSRDSMYGKLLDDEAKLIFLGDLIGLTFIHFVEETAGVPYRFMKRFHGTIVDGDKTYPAHRDYLVRCLDRDSIPLYPRLVSFLKENKLVDTITVNSATISCVECKKWFEAAFAQLKEDPLYFVRTEGQNAAN